MKTKNHIHLSNMTLWILIVVIKLNVLSVNLEFVPIQNVDPNDWREYGETANFAQFNNLYSVSIKEELLTEGGYSTGKCDQLMPSRMSIAIYLPYPNKCLGLIHHCWLKAESERRKAAAKKKADLDCPFGCTNDGYKALIHASIDYHWVGNDCYCMCERTYDPMDGSGGLLDSICFDSVSVDDDYVATGARFKRHGNVIHLELQQGILSGGRIDPNSLMWTTATNCDLAERVVYNFRNDGSYDALEIILEDMTLPENAVVTGVALGQSLRGRMINDDGNFDDHMDEIVKSSQCDGSPTDLVHGHSDLLPSTSLIGKNYELSTSCQHKIIFGGTAASSDHVQHIVPFVDLQAVVTDQNSPQPIRGIGWYYRSHPGYGGYLALKVFK